eukprot:Pgem_evm2s1679
MMKAIVQQKFGDAEVLEVVTNASKPVLRPRDVLINNKAFALNPVDQKTRRGKTVPHDFAVGPRILGWDGAGIITEIGSEVVNFKTGDEVYYSGDLTRAGSYAEYTAIDERLIAHKPKTLNFVEASTVPLALQTAWEALYEQQNIKSGQTVLVYNGAGGVGSIAIQLAKARNCTVIATASRPETIEWVKKMGADHVVNHREEIAPQLEAIGIKEVNHLFHLYDNKNLGQLMGLIQPFGSAALIGSLPEVINEIDWGKTFMKSISIHHEFMFTRSMFGHDQETVNDMLTQAATLIDEGKLHHTMTKTYKMSEIVEAHQFLESSKAIVSDIITTIGYL